MSRSTVFFLTLVVAALTFGGQAFAGDVKFSDFTITVPDKCKAEENDSMVLVNCGGETFFGIGLLQRNAQISNIQAFAEEVAKQTGGSKPAKNNDNNYEFDAIKDGVSIKSQIYSDGNMVVLYITDNLSVDWPKALEDASGSIKGNTPEVEAFLEKYLTAE